MKQLIKLSQSKRSPEVYYADFSNGDSLRITVNQIADFDLYTGCQLDDDRYAQLKASAERQNTKRRALDMLSHRPMSRKEITDKLTQKGENEENSEETAQWLEKVGLIDDSEYAAMAVRHYASRGYGIGRVRDELYRRGIPRELWEAALSEMPDQSETIDRLVENRLRNKETDKKEIRKLTDMLLRRGFSWEEIRSALLRYDCRPDGEEYE